MSFWSDPANVETLKRLWIDEGYSAAQISLHFKCAVSRSAICSKVHCLKLKRIHQRPQRATPRNNPRKRPPPAPLLNQPDPARDRFGLLFTLMTIGANQCRYGYGDPCSPHFHFCGQQTARGGSWCLFHHCLVYGKPVNAPPAGVAVAMSEGDDDPAPSARRRELVAA